MPAGLWGRRSAATTKSPPTLMRLVDLVSNEVTVGPSVPCRHRCTRAIPRQAMGVTGYAALQAGIGASGNAMTPYTRVRSAEDRSVSRNPTQGGWQRQLGPPEVAFCHPVQNRVVMCVRDRQHLAAYPAQGVHFTSLRCHKRQCCPKLRGCTAIVRRRILWSPLRLM